MALTQMWGDVLLMNLPFPADATSHLKTHVDEDHGHLGQLQVSGHGNRPVALN